MALALGRKDGEAVVITCPTGEIVTVIVKIIKNQNNKVRLVFMAPDNVQIDRKEVFDTKQRGTDA